MQRFGGLATEYKELVSIISILRVCENRFISPILYQIRLHVPDKDITTLCKWKQNLLARQTFRLSRSSIQRVYYSKMSVVNMLR